MINYVSDGIKEAFFLIKDRYVWEIALRSVKISSGAVFIASLWSLPLSFVIGIENFKGKFLIKNFITSFIGIPTVIWGLILYLLFVPKGPLGFLNLLYNEFGIAIGQAFLITPLIMSVIIDSIESSGIKVKETCFTLGASKTQTMFQILKEIYGWLILSLITGFNRAISELGIALMIGGNIYVPSGRYNTRILTTAIQMHTVRAEISTAIALGVILITIIIIVNFFSNLIKVKLLK